MHIRYQQALILVLLVITAGCVRRKAASTIKTIDDFSHLNATRIRGVFTPTSYQELAALVVQAQEEKSTLSIAGIRHSQGGHAFYTDSMVVSLKKLNNIVELDTQAKTITVQTGARWSEIQAYLNPHNLAVKIMQFANIFTLGGALSVNANGIDPHYGSLIESVHSIKIMLADGSIVQASRTENKELFALAIGGYGLFGIILEATLDVVENTLYVRESTILPLVDYVSFIRELKDDNSLGFHFGHLKLTPLKKNLFSEVVTITYKKIDETRLLKNQRTHLKKLYPEHFIPVKQWGMTMLRKSPVMQSLHWIPEAMLNGQHLSRNNIMSPPISHVYCSDKQNTNLLQEYFIPLDAFMQFMEAIDLNTRALKINVLYVAVRFIPKSTESFLSYLNHDSVGIVLFFSQKTTAEASHKTKLWTQALINAASACNGTYYLPSQLHADNEQIRKVYPKIDAFFALKKQYDSHGLFMNHFYKKYAL